MASFMFPDDWGNPVVTDHRTDSHKAYLLHGAGLDWILRFSRLTHRPFYLALRVGDLTSGLKSRIVAYEGWCDSTSFADQRARVAREAKLQIDGNPALVEESYFEPGGSAQQITTWYSGDRVYELTLQADVRMFDTVNYSQTLGIARLVELNPGDTALSEFMDGVDLLLKSFECRAHAK